VQAHWGDNAVMTWCDATRHQGLPARPESGSRAPVQDFGLELKDLFQSG
jgi:hypothetical protein